MMIMSEQIVFANGTNFSCPENQDIITFPQGRQWRAITVIATVEQAKATFISSASYTRQWDQPVYDTSGQATGSETMTEAMDAYCVAGDLVDHRDGTVTVYMGKKTEIEIYQETIDELMLAALGG